MNFKTYQKKAKTTAIYKRKYKVTYPLLGLISEIGEVASVIKKNIRDDAFIDKNNIEHELGDCLWYLAMISEDLGLDLDTIAAKNIAKLKNRMMRGVIKGSGDNR